MISPVWLALVLAADGVLAPRPTQAVTFAECQAFLCLPAGFSTHGGTPSNACDAAHAAVLARLRALKPALPSWSSCAAAFGWDAANLTHTEPRHADCPHGGTRSGTTCRYTDPDGCTWSYVSRERVTVQVVVDGRTNFQPNHTLTHTTRPAGTPALDPPTQDPLVCGPGTPTCQQLGTCPPPPPPGVCCPPEAVNYYWTAAATAPSKNLVCTHTFSYPPPQYPTPLNAPPPQRGGEPYNPPNCCPPWALHYQWAYDRNSLVCVLGGILPN